MSTTILKPIISEKSMFLAVKGTYMFEVPIKANKLMVADAVKVNFKVDVTNVRISVLKGKVKKFKGVTGSRKNRKRAFVTVKSGQKISIFEESK
ncbi:50S ribosomal protein L23 [Candidatus Saccharibacteria bacterium]|nr:50S ribosomal protein L23 [Candidatus Saccharibacteria bacterium]